VFFSKGRDETLENNPSANHNPIRDTVPAMKKIEAIVRHHKVEAIKEALVKAGFMGMTVSEVRGFGRQKGHKEMFRGAEYQVDFVPKVKMEVAANDDDVQKIIGIILDTARSGQIGDGKIFVTALEEVIRIRTSESGSAAL
jgi:nitrogen regulatory protein P-II 1